LVLALEHRGRDALENLAALFRRLVAPDAAVVSGLGGGDGLVRVFTVGDRDVAPGFLGRRVDRGSGLAAFGGLPLTIDEQAVFLHRVPPFSGAFGSCVRRLLQRLRLLKSTTFPAPVPAAIF